MGRGRGGRELIFEIEIVRLRDLEGKELRIIWEGKLMRFGNLLDKEMWRIMIFRFLVWVVWVDDVVRNKWSYEDEWNRLRRICGKVISYFVVFRIVGFSI